MTLPASKGSFVLPTVRLSDVSPRRRFAVGPDGWNRPRLKVRLTSLWSGRDLVPHGSGAGACPKRAVPSLAVPVAARRINGMMT